MPYLFINNLNQEQKKAALCTEYPSLILAGAGSGKTRVLTAKAAYLILKLKILPENILMITFTNKAAKEMKERINKIIKENLSYLKQSGFINMPYSGTFHSFGAKILRKEGEQIGISPKFIIYDETDQLALIKAVMEKMKISIKDFNPKSILGSISGAKNELIDPLSYQQLVRGLWQQTAAKVYREYQKTLKEQNALDFDDLLMETVILFKKKKEILQKYQKRFAHILVDEYQDTNRAQYELTKLLAGEESKITVVGDASQSIYSWRGADHRNLMALKKDYQNLKIFNLEQNYRSTKKILTAAYSVINKNKSHPVLKLWTENEKGEDIILYQARNEQEEAKFIAEEIIKLDETNHTAVLYRTNAQSRVLEEAFLHLGLPYVLVGGTRFYERKEIKDTLAYLRLLINPMDSVSFKRIEKLGKRRLEKFLIIKKRIENKLKNMTSSEILEFVLKNTGYLEIYDPNDEEDLARLENIKELKSVALEFSDLLIFLENIALVEQEYNPKVNQNNKAVTLMTLHSSKGLEFSNVFICGFEEGIFPHSRSLLQNSEIEEERRLCYVGITRAKKRLYLTLAKKRLFFGLRSENMISRFISEIPENLLRYKTNYEIF